ncbi:hypothetical protein C8N43_0042 [Litoreibacter ponti]|uniref:Uncharacterized protein n=1 Tax=Litoreibacter ponti TaxID=1510457 RepID=A0A2T6BH64_9RHOB|nr:hypothetical protein C8N43_0042 [Litoreibacter ponti]
MFSLKRDFIVQIIQFSQNVIESLISAGFLTFNSSEKRCENTSSRNKTCRSELIICEGINFFSKFVSNYKTVLVN